MPNAYLNDQNSIKWKYIFLLLTLCFFSFTGKACETYGRVSTSRDAQLTLFNNANLTQISDTTTSNLTITVDNSNGTPQAGAQVILYDANYVHLQTVIANSAGQAVFSNPGNANYIYEVYYKPTGTNSPITGNTEFWGSSTITVSASSVSQTFNRSQPFIQAAPSFSPASITTIQQTSGNFVVSNPLLRSENVYVEVWVNLNKSASGSVLLNNNNNPPLIASGGTATYPLVVNAPTDTGTYYYYAVVYANVNGNYIVTDHYNWTTAYLVNPSTIQWSGYTWDLRNGVANPGNNNWSSNSSNIWVDQQQNLHLKITKVGSTWYCPHLTCEQSLGYGEYQFMVNSRIDQLDENVVFGMFTYQSNPPDSTTQENEIDMEYSLWSNGYLPDNADFALQYRPFGDGNSLIPPDRFAASLTGNSSTHKFRWTQGNILFQSYNGFYDNLPGANDLIEQFNIADPRVPQPALEKAIINLWLFRGAPPSNLQTVEVVLQSFTFSTAFAAFTFNPIPSQTYGAADFDPGVTNNTTPITYSSGTTSVATIVSGKIHIVGAGTTTITATNGITTLTQLLTVNPAPLTITANNINNTYGTALTGGPGSTAFTSTGLQNSETIGSVTIAYGPGSGATDAVGTYTGSVTGSAATGGTFTAGNYSITYSPGNILVAAAPLTITANNVNKTYGTALTGGPGSTAFTAAGLQNSETIGSVTIAYGAGSGATDAVGTYTDSVTGSAASGGTFTAGNYSITYNPGNILVAAAPLTITANNVNKTYGSALTGGPGSTAFTSTGLQNSETVGSLTITYGTGSAATAPVGTYTGSITGSAATGGTFTAGNYSITYNPGDIIVAAAPLTITANNVNKTYGTALTGGPGSTTFITTGLQNSETIGSVTIAYGAGSAATDALGTYTASVTGSAATGGTFTAGNYSITYSPGNILVAAAPLTITANTINKTYGTALTGGPGSTAFTATGLQNSEAIGSVTIAYGAGSGATDAVGTYTGSVTGSAASGGTFTAGNYSITYNPGNILVAAAPLTITANNVNKTYGSALTGGPGSTAFTSTGLQNSETVGSLTITYGTGSAATAPVGTYTGSITGSAATGGTFTAGNYSISYIAGTLTVLPSSNANLSTLTISSGTLSPAFSTNTTSYTASVSAATASVTITPVAGDPNAIVKVNGTAVASGSASGTIALAVGSNTITIVVTAQDGTTTHTYIIAVTRATPSAVATLSAITLTPASTLTNTGTTGTTTTYTTSVVYATALVTVTPTATDATATIKVNGVAVTSGIASGSIALAVGSNIITTVVTAQNGTTTHTYTITVTRAAASAIATLSAITLTPVSTLTSTGTTGTTTTYTTSVVYTTASVTVTPIATDATATIKVNGVTVTSGAASGSIALAVGSNTITTVVTAQNGTTTHTYTITVTRATPSAVATLSAIILTPASTLTSTGTTGTTTTYTTSVVYTTASVTVTPTATDATATIKVNGVAVTSGIASGSIALAVGSNTITTIVTAQNGTTTHTYTITVTRAAASAIATLSAIILTPVSTLASTGTTGTTTTYTTSVVYTTASVTVTPTATDATATIKVNGVTVKSGAASGSIALAVGSNTITTVVTAQNVTTTHTYTITVTRAAASAVATLSAIKLTPASTLTTTGTTGTTTTYTTSVSNATTSVTVTPTATDATATIKVNGVTVKSGAASGSIALAVGSNTITTIVTAQDGVTTHTYSITVTRASGALLALYQPISVVKPTDDLSIENDGVMVHQGVSPNGDGINDVLSIDGIIQYPNNQLTIIDRNGSLIFQARGYDNISKTFDGHSSINGRMQQPGTYFYSLDYVADGQNRHKTGFILLKY